MSSTLIFLTNTPLNVLAKTTNKIINTAGTGESRASPLDSYDRAMTTAPINVNIIPITSWILSVSPNMYRFVSAYTPGKKDPVMATTP